MPRKTWKCKKCGKRFYAPWKVAQHARHEHPRVITKVHTSDFDRLMEPGLVEAVQQEMAKAQPSPNSLRACLDSIYENASLIQQDVTAIKKILE